MLDAAEVAAEELAWDEAAVLLERASRRGWHRVRRSATGAERRGG